MTGVPTDTYPPEGKINFSGNLPLNQTHARPCQESMTGQDRRDNRQMRIADEVLKDLHIEGQWDGDFTVWKKFLDNWNFVWKVK